MIDSNFKKQFQQKIMSPDSIKSKSAFIIDFSIFCVITRNPKWIKYQYDKGEFDLGLNKIEMIKLKNLELYQNNFTTTLQELTNYDPVENSQSRNASIKN